VDVPGIAAATIAGKEAVAEQKEAAVHAEELQRYLMESLPAAVLLTGNPMKKSPFIQGLLLPHVEGQWMMLECNRQQIAISTGTACKIGAGEALSAMSAIGIEQDAARKFIRISFSAGTTAPDIDAFLDVVRASMATFAQR